jgi:cation diffusion facilitator CzcD-associated flavoprotein CzcO
MLEIAIIGAGPYGLSVAAHFKRAGIPFRVFGRPMDSWLAHMPKDMMLKSDGFASNIYDPNGDFTLERFCAERGIEYAHMGVPVKLDTFCDYGLAFRERIVPEVEEKVVVALERIADGFRITLDDGEVFTVRRVVLAIGITHYAFMPSKLAELPPAYVSHSSAHREVEQFRGRDVVVMGGGSSAIDLAALLHDTGANVQLVARRTALKFHERIKLPRPLWERIRRPESGLGPGLQSRFYSNFPWLFRYLPLGLRLKIVRTHLGPSGGWTVKDRVVGHVPLVLGQTMESVDVRDGRVHLQLRGMDGGKREVVADHIIAATGFKVDLKRLAFLSADVRSQIKTVENAPVLRADFESSVPGLYFVGVSGANTFGPLMRFAYGAGFAAQRVTQSMLKVLGTRRVAVPDAHAAIAK